MEHVLRAVILAHEAGARGDRPFGAVLVAADGTVLAEGRNAVSTTGDIRAHAELDAIEAARAAGLTEKVVGATMVASGEPCPMCAAGMVWAGITHVVFAAAEADFAPLLGEGPRFTLPCAEVLARCTAEVTVTGPVDGVDALAPFAAFTRSRSAADDR